jgi:calpain
MYCEGPMLRGTYKVDGKQRTFGGRLYELGQGKKVHFECYEAYNMAHAAKCEHCRGPMLKGAFLVGGKQRNFDGLFYNLGQGKKVHSECHGAFAAASRGGR